VAALQDTLAALTALAPEAAALDLDPALFGRALGALDGRSRRPTRQATRHRQP
jgi:hypothetical protein